MSNYCDRCADVHRVGQKVCDCECHDKPAPTRKHAPTFGGPSMLNFNAKLPKVI